MSLEARIARLEALASQVQLRGVDLSSAEPAVVRVYTAAASTCGCALVRVPSDYYERPLAARAALLHSHPTRLCKTLILCNATGTVEGNPAAPLHEQRFLAVVVQYVARWNPTAVGRVLCASATAAGVTAYAPRVALAEAADALRVSGFAHGAVSPLATAVRLPVLFARAALADGAAVWLGGGAVDVKLRVFPGALVRAAAVSQGKEPPPGINAVTVCDVSTPRADGDGDDE